MKTQDRLKTLRVIAENYFDWVEDNSYQSWHTRGMGSMLSVDVKQRWGADTDDVIHFIKKHENITPEFEEFLEEELTETEIESIYTSFMEHEREYLVFDWAYMLPDDKYKYIKEILDKDVVGLYGRSGGHYCFAESNDIMTYIDSAIEIINDIQDGWEEDEGAIFDAVTELKAARDKIDAAQFIINEVESMSKGLEASFYNECVFRIVEENILEFESEDNILEEKLNVITD